MDFKMTIDVAVVVFLIVIMNFAIKKVIKKTEVYPLIVFCLAMILSAIYNLIYRDSNFLKAFFEKGFIWGASAISFYDVIIEKIEGFFEKKNDKKNN